jgi:hypothetical protein
MRLQALPGAAGRLLDAEGRPLAGRRIEFWWKEDRMQRFNQRRCSTYTDEQGRFDCRALEPGRWAALVQWNVSDPYLGDVVAPASGVTLTLRPDPPADG